LVLETWFIIEGHLIDETVCFSKFYWGPLSGQHFFQKKSFSFISDYFSLSKINKKICWMRNWAYPWLTLLFFFHEFRNLLMIFRWALRIFWKEKGGKIQRHYHSMKFISRQVIFLKNQKFSFSNKRKRTECQRKKERNRALFLLQDIQIKEKTNSHFSFSKFSHKKAKLPKFGKFHLSTLFKEPIDFIEIAPSIIIFQ